MWRISSGVFLAVVSLVMGSLAVRLGWVLGKATRRKRRTDLSFHIGDTGIAETSFAPHGYVCLGGEVWPAEADEPLPRGARVRVIGSSGIHLKVESVW